MLYGKAYRIRDFETGEERKTPTGGDLYAMAHVGEITKGPSDLDRSFWMVASNQTRDRDGDVIRQKGWNLKNFKKNPVGLWAHNYHELPVFRVPDIKVVDDKLMALMHFPEELGGLSDDVYRAFMAKVLKASSVGFGVEEVVEDKAKRVEFGLPEDTGYGNGYLFWKTELWELSAVTVPSNPEALAQIKAMDGADKLKEILQHAEDFVIELKEPESCEGEDDGADDGSPDFVLAEDFESMKLILEENGYTVSEQEPEPAEVVLDLSPEPQVVVLDLSPEPSVNDAEANEIARSVFHRIRHERIKDAVKREINYAMGKIPED